MTKPYAGKLLRIDLTESAHHVQPIDDPDVRHVLLGSGLAAKIFYEEMDPDLDTLDPASPLLALNGALTGTFSPTGCRSSWCGRSPLTGIWNEANTGGHWGAERRFAGFDGLIITGKATEPVYLWIHDGELYVGRGLRPSPLRLGRRPLANKGREAGCHPALHFRPWW